MTSRLLRILLLVLISSAPLLAQDTAFVPGGAAAWDPEWQQIPGPKCLEQRGAWEGGSSACTSQDHEIWLADLTHWRTERRIRIGYDDFRYDLPALKWTQSSFMQPQMMVQDRYLYDPVAIKYTVDRYLDDTRQALRRHRCRPRLADLSQHGHRQPQSARHGALHARRHCWCSSDGRRLSQTRRARTLPHDDVGSRHSRTRLLLARRYRQPDGGNRRGRHQWRHARRRPLRLRRSRRTPRPSPGVSTRRRPAR